MKKAALMISFLLFFILCVSGLKIQETEAKTKIYYTTERLRVREYPSTTSKTLTTLGKGVRVNVVSVSKGWAKIKYKNKQAFVANSYLETRKSVEKKVEEKKPEETKITTEKGKNGFLVAIDAGHQRKANTSKEPIGPNAKQTKFKVTGGTRGTTTGLYEYELALDVSLKLQKELEERGYRVLMIRTAHDVDISNSERAAMANEAEADAFIRIHANGSNNPKVHGAMTICQTKNNRFNGHLYEKAKDLSTKVLDEMIRQTGAKRLMVWETDTMSGINWAKVPTTIVEMGYMTNPQEDELMASEEYQDKLVKGMADGIDQYFGLE